MDSTRPGLFNRPYLLLTLTAMAWGGNAIAGKMAVGEVSPFLLTNLRWLLVMILLTPIAVPQLKKDWAEIRRHWLFLMLLGAVGFAIFNNMMYLALNYTSAINVGIVQASMPLFVFAMNYAIFRIKSNALQMIGFLITLIGVLITVTGGNPMALIDTGLNFGDLLMLAAIIAYGGYSVALKNKPQIHWLSFITVLGFSAFLTSIPFAAIEWAMGNQILPTMKGLGVVVYTAVFPSIISQVFWMRGLQLIGSNRGGVFINLVPIFSTTFAILLLGENFHLFHAVSLVLVIGGVALAQDRAKAKIEPRI